MKKKIVFAFILFFSFGNFVFSQTITNFVLSLFIYQKTGIVKDFSEEDFAHFSNAGANIVFRTSWSKEGKNCYLVNYLFPDCFETLDLIQVYSPENDDGSWVDKLNFTEYDFEKVQKPEILDNFEKNLLDEEETQNFDEEKHNEDGVIIETVQIEADSEQNENNINSSSVNNSYGKNILTHSNALSLFLFEDEKFAVDENDKNKIFVTSRKSSLIRKFYDDKMHLVKKEFWKNTDSIENAFISKIQTFVYKDDKIFSSKIEEENTVQELFYDEKERVVLSSLYKKNKENLIPVSKTEYIFNENNKILSKSTVDFKYDSEYSLSSRKTFSRKDVYEYKNPENPPDFFYYENDFLRMKTLYRDSKNYIQVLYFENDFVVESYYKDGFHSVDLYYSQGTLRRKRVYEMGN